MAESFEYGVTPAPERKVQEGEKERAAKLLAEVERAKKLRKNFDETTLPRLRQVVWNTSSASRDEGENEIKANLINATIATLLPHIYAKNPDVSVSPSEAVSDDEYEAIKDFCKTAEVFIQRMILKKAGLKARMKSAARSAMTTSVGWVKLTLQQNITGDPMIVRRHNDIQDNLRKLAYLKSCVAEGDKAGDAYEQKMEELRQALKSLQSNPELKQYKGFALDRIQTEDVLILDESVIEFDDYVSAKRLAHRIWLNDEDFEAAFGYKPGKATVSYKQPAPGDQRHNPDGGGAQGAEGKDTCFRAVWEIWDITTNTIYTVCEGNVGYCREPYSPEEMPERWYPFFALGFNAVEGRWRPVSDVELLEKLQQEYNKTRFLFSEARKESIPVYVFRKGGSLTEEDIKKLSNRKARNWVGIEGNPQVPLKDEVQQFPGVAIDPAAFDVTLIRNDMDMMVGLSDASRSNLIQAKTATEAEIMRQSLMTRVAERQDCIEDMVGAICEAGLQQGLRAFSREEVEHIVGAGAMWPEVTRPEDIFTKVRVEVKAGSSGKPNLLKEREQWGQMLEIINATVDQVMELRANGQVDLAQTKIELLKETLRRFDERIDVDRFIPRQQEGEDPAGQMAGQMQQMAAQMQQMQEMAAKLQEENQKLQQQAEQAKAAAEAKAIQAQADAQLKAEQQAFDQQLAREKMEGELQIKREQVQEELRIKAEAEQAKLAMAEAGAEHERSLSLTQQEHAQALERAKARGEGADMPEPGSPGKTDIMEQIVEGQAQLGQVLTQTLTAMTEAMQQQSQQALQAMQQTAATMQQAVTALTEVASMDAVPQRDPKTGDILRVTKVPKGGNLQ